MNGVPDDSAPRMDDPDQKLCSWHTCTAIDSVGMFRALPLNESSAFSQVRIYRPDQELDGAGPNVPLLREVSELTGGRFNPEPSSIFTPDG